MDREIPLPPDTGWGTEVRELMCEHSLGFGETCNRVVLRYLAEGDLRPLVDLLYRGRVEPGESVFRYIAAMSANQGPTPFRFGIEVVRSNGRPRVAGFDASRATNALAVVTTGFDSMSVGRNPGWRFWKQLLSALSAADPDEFPDFPDSAIKARVFLRKKTRGRRIDPELVTRNKLLAWNVQKRLDCGDGYESAVEGTKEAIKAFASQEGKSNDVSTTTVGNAYDSSRAVGADK